MKIKNITITYTDNTTTKIKPTKGFLITQEQIWLFSNVSINEVMNLYTIFLTNFLSTKYIKKIGIKSYKPIFDMIDTTAAEIKQKLDKNIWSKDLANEFFKKYIWQEILTDQKLPIKKRQYQELFTKTSHATEKAARYINNTSQKLKTTQQLDKIINEQNKVIH